MALSCAARGSAALAGDGLGTLSRGRGGPQGPHVAERMLPAHRPACPRAAMHAGLAPPESRTRPRVALPGKGRPGPAHRLRAYAGISEPETRPSDGVHGPSLDALACPICFGPLAPAAAGVCCRRCARAFQKTTDYLDLTLQEAESQTRGAAGPLGRLLASLPGGLDPSLAGAGTQLFRSPLVSYAYERGWRQGFAWAGFPGVESEFATAAAWLAGGAGTPSGTESGTPSVLVDMSCGSGLFSRRFAAAGAFRSVVAADFSESMLAQCRAYVDADPVASAALAAGRLTLVRADVARMPFATASVAGVHAAAALHCWPNPAAAFAEASRVLAPGGAFVGSTFLLPTAAAAEATGWGDEAFRPLSRLLAASPFRSPQLRMWEESEIRALAAQAGLVDFKRVRSRQFILWCASKPAPGRPNVAATVDPGELRGVSV